MSDINEARTKRWKLGGGTIVVLIVTVICWNEFFEPGKEGWNALLFFMVAGFSVGAIILNWYFTNHYEEIGEARFDTRNKSEIDG